MSSGLRIVVAVVCLAIPGQVFVCAARGQNRKQREEKLAAKIERQDNPGKKARLQLRLAKLNLKGADAAYRSSRFDEAKANLQQYLDHIKASWSTLSSHNQGDQGVRKHLRAFKDLEISLREDDRFLEDLRHRVPYPQNEFILQIEKQSRAVHNKVLEALFPEGFSPKGKRNRPLSPKSSKAAKAGALKS